MTSSVHPLEQTKVPFNDMYSESATTSFRANQQRAHSVTTMPPELQHKQQQQQQGPQLAKGQPWWQYYYQLYHYQLPPGRKPTVFGPYLLLQTLGEGEFGKVKFGIEAKTGQEVTIANIANKWLFIQFVYYSCIKRLQ
jgi:hypothetical protein